ncbi:MAG: hypothetical protein ABSG18_01615 [Steroidobacteraceae bacterium]|jgi:hypothetical protein
MDKAIFTATAALDDNAAMAKFLSPIPNGEQLAKVLGIGKPLSTRAYEDETQTARFVVSDGNTATCFTVADVTIDQAEMIAAACEDMHAWGEKAFREAVEQALGTAFDRVQ